MIALQDFLKIGDRVREKWGRQFYKHVDFCGLEPVTDRDYRYDSTPINSVTFAATGGDGVHFGLLAMDNEMHGRQPIVMTVPMVSKNIILADTLDEFFGLGFYNGWFGLEQLVYDFNRTINDYSTQDESLTIQEKNFLELIKTELKFKHEPLTKERLDTLAALYQDNVSVE
jgi:hypothetical protein